MTAAGASARHGLEYLVARGVELGLRPLPMRTVRSAGESVGHAAYLGAGSRRRIALDNLMRAFPASTPVERDAIVRGMFRHFGRLLLELVRFGSLSGDQMLSLSDTDGVEHVTQAYERGRGVILVGAHFGYWEMQGLTHALCWRPIGVMARPLDNPRLHAMLEAARTRTGNSVIYRQGSLRKVLRTLGDNRAVAILIDQHLHSPEAVQVNFFGRPAATTSIVGTLAHRTGAAVIPAFGLPRPGGRYHFVYERPVDAPADGSPDAIREFTQRCSDAIEHYVRRYPDLWLWMHRRWRDAPAAAPAVRATDGPGLTLDGPHV